MPADDGLVPLRREDLTEVERELAATGADLGELARRRMTGVLVASRRDLALCGIAGTLAGFDASGTAALLAVETVEPLHGEIIGVDELLDVLVPRLVAVWAAERLAPLGFALQLLTATEQPGSPLAGAPAGLLSLAAALVVDVLGATAAAADRYGFTEETLTLLGLTGDDPAGLALLAEFVADCAPAQETCYSADLLSAWADEHNAERADVAHAALLAAAWADLRRSR